MRLIPQDGGTRDGQTLPKTKTMETTSLMEEMSRIPIRIIGLKEEVERI